MADEIQDKKLTQDQADKYMAPLELDLLSIFKVMENDMMDISEKYKGTPERLIDDIVSFLSETSRKIEKNMYLEKAAKPIGYGEL